MQSKTPIKHPAWPLTLLMAIALPAVTVPARAAETDHAGPASTNAVTALREAMPEQPFGAPLAAERLENQRGGTDPGTPASFPGVIAVGAVGGNRAVDVITGSNAIRDGAFANASGLPVVIQNTGANVLIQSATVVNVQLR